MTKISSLEDPQACDRAAADTDRGTMRPYQSISGQDINGGHRSTDEALLEAALARRERANAGNCINGDTHGPATHGCRCRRCFAVHRYGLAIVNERGLDALDLHVGRKRRAPGYKVRALLGLSPRSGNAARAGSSASTDTR